MINYEQVNEHQCRLLGNTNSLNASKLSFINRISCLSPLPLLKTERNRDNKLCFMTVSFVRTERTLVSDLLRNILVGLLVVLGCSKCAMPIMSTQLVEELMAKKTYHDKVCLDFSLSS